MTMTDPIADMLTRIRNANTVKHETVDVPASNIKKEIANGKPVVTSFKLGNISGHLMTVKGYTNNQVYVYDTYGCTYLKDFKEKGNAKILSYKEFKELAKPTDSENKFCICFY